MKESMYLSMLSQELEKKFGGKVTKLHDASTLGLPDSLHMLDSIGCFIEAKICNDTEVGLPWKIIARDLRQYEVCRMLSHFALVVYCIYWPRIKMSMVLDVRVIDDNYPGTLRPGHGFIELKEKIEENRRYVYEKLQLREGSEGIHDQVRSSHQHYTND